MKGPRKQTTSKELLIQFGMWLQNQVHMAAHMNAMQTRQEDQGEAIRRLVSAVAVLNEERADRLADRSRDARGDAAGD